MSNRVELQRQAKLAKVNDFINQMGLADKEGFSIKTNNTYYDGGWNCEGKLVRGALTDRKSVMAKVQRR